MATLNLSIVNVSLPTIVAEFGADIGEAQLVVVSYVAVVTALLVTAGRLGDRVGRRSSYVAGFAVFAGGAALCGAAQGVLELMIFRALQALGAAMLIASGPAVIAETQKGGRGQALGLVAIAVAAGLTVGNVLGGIIVEFLGWRWIFLVNVPVGVAGVLMARAYVPQTRLPVAIDWTGAVFFAAAVLSLLAGLGAPGTTRFAGVAVALGFFVAFLAWERRARDPLIPRGLGKDRFVVLGTATVLLTFVAMATSSFLIPFYLANVLGASPSTIGIVLFANPLGFSFVGPFSGRLHDRLPPGIGNALAPLGLGVAAAGFVLLASLGAAAPLPVVFVELFVIGIGMGLFMAPNNSALLGAVRRDMLGVLSGVIATMRNLGMSLGFALAGQLFLLLNPAGADAPAGAFVPAMNAVFLAAAGILAVAAGLSLARPRPAETPVVSVAGEASPVAE